MRRLFSLLLALCLSLSGCAAAQEQDIGQPLIYYAVADSTAYGASALQGEAWEDAPDTPAVEDYVNKMMETPQDTGLYVIFPEQLRLLSWTQEDGLLTLDFSEEYSELTGITLTLANSCLILTLTQIEGVEEVTVTVMGRTLPEGSGPMSAADLLLTGESPDPVTLGFQIYFPLSDGGGLGTEYRETELSGTGLDDQISAVIQLLTDGPRASDEMTAAFEGLESQLESEMVDEVCLLTLTESWAQLLAENDTARQALVNSLCELEGIETVAFSGAGTEETALSGTFQAVYD